MQSPTAQLIAEIERYLRAVDVFRREGCEPCWRREPLPARTLRPKERTC
jgi:hypothetical protein